jgi:hypothetical protein
MSSCSRFEVAGTTRRKYDYKRTDEETDHRRGSDEKADI